MSECPLHEPDVTLDPEETLYVPLRRRFLSEYAPTPDGGRELRLYYGLKEITFDEPELLRFGERLLEQDAFVAGSATGWTDGPPLAWAQVQELLAALLTEGILTREPPAPKAETDYHRRVLQREATRAAPETPLWWNPDTPGVTQRLAGRALELGWVEAMLPLHRLAHPALDAEGRHVGENNVFPEAMRMRQETEYKVCPYSGSRFRDDALMNVTALRSMTKQWKPTLRALLVLREAWLRRYPLHPDGRWRLGDLHAFCCTVLALPTLLLMRADAPVPNGALDPMLSSLFRSTDGVRMVAIYLMHLPEEAAPFDHPITAAELLRYTERDNHFLSTRGVCAGPQNMVEEFLATLMDGRPVAGDGPYTTGHDHEIPRALDYGLRGLQLYCLQFTLWSHMGRAYERIHGALQGVDADAGGAWGRLKARVERDWKIITPTRQNTAEQRAWAGARYEEMFQHAQRGLRGFREADLWRLQDALAPGAPDEAVGLRLRELLHAQAGAAPVPGLVDAVADALADYLATERAALGALEAVQREVNLLLGRPHPTRPFSSLDLAIHLQLRVGTIGSMTYLPRAFADALGLHLESTSAGTQLGLHPAPAASAA